MALLPGSTKVGSEEAQDQLTGALPPLTVMLTLPLSSPLQRISTEVPLTSIESGCRMVIEVSLLQPKKSVIVTL